MQSEAFPVAYGSDTNMLISAPTGSGKTGVMELAILRLLSQRLDPSGASLAAPLAGSRKVVYLAPTKALVQEKHRDWSARFGAVGLRCLELTGVAGAAVQLTATLPAFPHASLPSFDNT